MHLGPVGRHAPVLTEIQLRADHGLAQRAVHQGAVITERRGIKAHWLVIYRQQIQLAVVGHERAGNLAIGMVVVRPTGAARQQGQTQGGENEADGRSHVVLKGFPETGLAQKEEASASWCHGTACDAEPAYWALPRYHGRF
ncbi:hypothetical protein D3C81_793800 [compost metagenome]